DARCALPGLVSPALSDMAASALEPNPDLVAGDADTEAVALGSRLLRLSGSVEKAAKAVNQERLIVSGNHLAFTEGGHVQGITNLHRAYLLEMAQDGVPSRREAVPARESAKNHGSVRGHEEELMQKAWKDAAYGVAESPLGTVPKQQNEQGSKFNHPPPPQPRILESHVKHYAGRPGIQDVPEFAVRMMGIVITSLVMPFGWVGAPGEFVAWSAAAKVSRGSFHPPDPWLNDTVSYDSKGLVDDG
ncbi:unnamed protein product, partial [Symbiodinium pilosum]